MIDLNDLRIFAYVASLASFSSAAEALQIHKSSVSRSVMRLEAMLEAPLLQRTTRKVLLTPRGLALKAHCVDILSRIAETIGYAGQINDAPRPLAGESMQFTTRSVSAGDANRTRLRKIGSSLPNSVATVSGRRRHEVRPMA